MRKELILAIVIGSILGLAIAFGIWRANKAFTPEGRTGTSQSGSQTPSPKTTPGIIDLAITSPEDNLVVSSDKITIEGTTIPNATIVIVGNAGEIIAEAGKDGSFKDEIGLAGGANEIKITAYDETGNKAEKTLTIVYSTEFPGKVSENK